MSKDRWIFKEIKARSGQGPPWLPISKGEHTTYVLRHDPKSGEVTVFRDKHFALPSGKAAPNKITENVALASTPDGLTGEYVDFLLPGSTERYQTTKSLLEEVFEGKNPRKPVIKREAKAKQEIKKKYVLKKEI